MSLPVAANCAIGYEANFGDRSYEMKSVQTVFTRKKCYTPASTVRGDQAIWQGAGAAHERQQDEDWF
jgi:hypothetical protein